MSGKCTAHIRLMRSCRDSESPKRAASECYGGSACGRCSRTRHCFGRDAVGICTTVAIEVLTGESHRASCRLHAVRHADHTVHRIAVEPVLCDLRPLAEDPCREAAGASHNQQMAHRLSTEFDCLFVSSAIANIASTKKTHPFWAAGDWRGAPPEFQKATMAGVEGVPGPSRPASEAIFPSGETPRPIHESPFTVSCIETSCLLSCRCHARIISASAEYHLLRRMEGRHGDLSRSGEMCGLELLMSWFEEIAAPFRGRDEALDMSGEPAAAELQLRLRQAVL